MKRLFNNVLLFGIREGLSQHEIRKIKTTNALNVVAALVTIASFANYFSLGRDFALIPVLIILFCSIFSLFLSKLNQTGPSFVLFTFYVNLSVFYFCKYHPFETANYLYYFPLIVSVVLLNNPGFSIDRYTVIHLVICLLFISGTFLLDIPGFQLSLSPDKVRFLLSFNIVAALLITVVISFLLTRLISKQNTEIMQQNFDLIRTKEAVNISLREKEILLAELHHRVKNNLAIISGLLNLQDSATTNEEAKEVIGDSKSRIMSMALVHRMLYENADPTGASLKNLELGKYINELVQELFNSYNLAKYVNIKQDYDRIILPVSKSIPLGLILNEIVTNSIKYVYRTLNKEKGEFFISVKEKENVVSIIVKDNGKGFPDSFNADVENPSLGIYLIKTLCEQIDGKVRFSNENGAKIELNFALH